MRWRVCITRSVYDKLATTEPSNQSILVTNRQCDDLRFRLLRNDHNQMQYIQCNGR